MWAVQCTGLEVVSGMGPGSSLSVVRVADPGAPGPGEVVVRVRGASLNFADLLQLRGEYQERRTPPFTAGGEVSGVVEGVGEGVAHVAAGDRVVALAPSGALAERCVVPGAVCFALPPGVPRGGGALADAAGVLVAFGTAYVGLTDQGALRPGETLLVTGAAGGVGLAACLLGARLGARVVAVVRGDAKARAVRAALDDDAAQAAPGAQGHLVLDAQAGDWGKAMAAAKVRADVVFDPVGGDAFDTAFGRLAWGARVVVVGFAGGKVQHPRANVLLVKNASVRGLYWGSYATHAPEQLRETTHALLADHFAGPRPLHVPVGMRVPLSAWRDAAERGDVAAAATAVRRGFTALASRNVVGKVIIEMGDEAGGPARAKL